MRRTTPPGTRRAPLAAALALLVLLTGCGTSDEEYERRILAACQDNQSRAYTAATDATTDGGRSKAEALANLRTYVAEVRRTPECFAGPLRHEVEKAALAAERGELLRLEHPKGAA